jgi:hypothetical protein
VSGGVSGSVSVVEVGPGQACVLAVVVEGAMRSRWEEALTGVGAARNVRG